MTRVEALIASLVVLLGAALGYYFFFGVPFLSHGQIEGFDTLIARLGEAAASGRVAPGLETPVCQSATPKHIGELAQDALGGKPAVECGSELQPGAALAQPVTVVDFDKKRVDAINDTLPDPLRAPTLGTAATIAFIHCSKRKTGSYGFFRDELYTACVNGPYYREYLPDVLREIIDRSHPEGITDNSWSGLTRDNICHCENCAAKFKASSSHDLPREKNWNDPVYRQWIQWSYACRLEIWDLNNRVTKAAGGPECLWLGMNGGSITGQSQNFRDTREVCRRSEIVMLDHQARTNAGGFQNNGLAGKLIHGLLGWDRLIPESMGMYQAGQPQFRFSSKPGPEVRLWMLDGFAGGIQPWWHHLGAYQEDRRMFRTAEPILRWHAENQQYLINRRPVATVGLVWSQPNTDFYGRDNAEELVELPRRGWTNALVRARIPYLPVHADHITRDADQFSVLILPNLAAMSASQIEAVKYFVERGGGIVATGDASRCNELGEPQSDFALADLFGAFLVEKVAALERFLNRALERIERVLVELAELHVGIVEAAFEEEVG